MSLWEPQPVQTHELAETQSEQPQLSGSSLFDSSSSFCLTPAAHAATARGGGGGRRREGGEVYQYSTGTVEGPRAPAAAGAGAIFGGVYIGVSSGKSREGEGGNVGAVLDWVQIERQRQKERERRQKLWEDEARIEREEEEVETALRAGRLVGPAAIFVQDLELYSF